MCIFGQVGNQLESPIVALLGRTGANRRCQLPEVNLVI
jgi:hypothetical protein